jgi:hypothetical protein
MARETSNRHYVGRIPFGGVRTVLLRKTVS